MSSNTPRIAPDMPRLSASLGVELGTTRPPSGEWLLETGYLQLGVALGVSRQTSVFAEGAYFLRNLQGTVGVRTQLLRGFGAARGIPYRLDLNLGVHGGAATLHRPYERGEGNPVQPLFWHVQGLAGVQFTTFISSAVSLALGANLSAGLGGIPHEHALGLVFSGHAYANVAFNLF